MDVLTFETCCAVNSEIIKQVTTSWSIFIQYAHIFKILMYFSLDQAEFKQGVGPQHSNLSQASDRPHRLLPVEVMMIDS